MKALTVILTLIVTLLAGSFSLPTAHAMPMSDTVSSVAAHECCDEQQSQHEATPCEQESSFCQHCEQHCAGQIGLVNKLSPWLFQATESLTSKPLATLLKRSERLIRPPKPLIA
ncbi:MAG: hypothetical protein ACQEQ8_03635 [Pseudomonadota bacterium]